MAVIRQRLEIDADPSRPKEEITNIIAGFLQLWPGSEVDILKTVRTEIDRSIAAYEKGDEAHANDVSSDS